MLYISYHATRCATKRSSFIPDFVLTREPDLVSNIEVMEHLGNSNYNMAIFSIHREQEIMHNTRLLCDYCKRDYQSIRNVLAA